MTVESVAPEYADILLRRHFQTPDALPLGWQPVSATALGPLHRNILVTDGTVTRTLEAYALEPIEAVALEQTDTLHPGPEAGWLDLDPGDPVTERRVDLVGVRSKTHYARARSVLANNRLPHSFWTALLVERAGIGAALNATGAESQRQLLSYGRPPGAICGRRYRILLGGRPAVVIQEEFLH